jgi:hypothetical protein
LWSPEAGRVAVDWIIPVFGDEPTCFVIERRVDDGDFDVVAIVPYSTGWWDPTYFDGAVQVTYRVFAANEEARSDSDEETIFIPAHTPFVTPSTSLRGDVDCDLDVDAFDVLLLLDALAGLPALQSSDSCYMEPRPGERFDLWWRWGRTDFDCNGTAGPYDVLVLLQFLAGTPLGVHRFCAASWP